MQFICYAKDIASFLHKLIVNPVYMELFSSEAGKLLKQINCDPYHGPMSLEQLAVNFDLLGI